jgi:hypothetical protein
MNTSTENVVTDHFKSVSSLSAIFLLTLCGLFFLTGCSSGTGEKTEETRTPASAETAAKTTPKAPFVPVDACSLMTKADVEAVTGKIVLEPVKQPLANLVTCLYGDPGSQAGGRALSQILTLDVFTGEEGAYFAGPVAQAKDAFETGRKNANSPQTVPGLGQDAYWDQTLHTLHVYKDRYEVSVTVDSDLGLQVARKAAENALTKLP